MVNRKQASIIIIVILLISVFYLLAYKPEKVFSALEARGIADEVAYKYDPSSILLSITSHIILYPPPIILHDDGCSNAWLFTYLTSLIQNESTYEIITIQVIKGEHSSIYCDTITIDDYPSFLMQHSVDNCSLDSVSAVKIVQNNQTFIHWKSESLNISLESMTLIYNYNYSQTCWCLTYTNYTSSFLIFLNIYTQTIIDIVNINISTKST